MNSNELKSCKGIGFVEGVIKGLCMGGIIAFFGVAMMVTSTSRHNEGAGLVIFTWVVALLVLIIWPLVGLTKMEGLCPYCGNKVFTKLSSGCFKCPTCEKKIQKNPNEKKISQLSIQGERDDQLSI